jgi:hypothetical protein
VTTLVVVPETEADHETFMVWQRIEAARLIERWSESQLGETLFDKSKRTALTTQKSRGFRSRGKGQADIVNALTKRGYSKEWLLLGKGRPRADSPNVPGWEGDIRELAIAVAVHRGADLTDVVVVAGRLQALYVDRSALPMWVDRWVSLIEEHLKLPRQVPARAARTVEIPVDEAWRDDVLTYFVQRGTHVKEAKKLVDAVVAFHWGGPLPPAAEAVEKFVGTVGAITKGKAKGIREL